MHAFWITHSHNQPTGATPVTAMQHPKGPAVSRQKYGGRSPRHLAKEGFGKRWERLDRRAHSVYSICFWGSYNLRRLLRQFNHLDPSKKMWRISRFPIRFDKLNVRCHISSLFSILSMCTCMWIGSPVMLVMDVTVSVAFACAGPIAAIAV